MQKIPATVSLVLAALVGVLQPTPALAQGAPLPIAATAAAVAGEGQCAALAIPAAGSAQTSKAEALLGGQPSQLEILRRQQGGQLAGSAAKRTVAGAVLGLDCSRLVLPRGDDAKLSAGRGIQPRAPEDFLASKRLPVSRTSFDTQWTRVLSGTLPRSAASTFAGFSAAADGERLLAAVNAYANRRIRYVDDRALYGRADYWANASATLARGAGDCEDIAIAKLQLLAAAGVRRDDMFLTIARDPVRKADHAVLVVRLGGRFWLLDNTSDRVVDAAPSYDYRPIFSFSASGRWLHGY